MAELPRRGGDMLIKHNLRPEQAVEARDCLVDTLIQTSEAPPEELDSSHEAGTFQLNINFIWKILDLNILLTVQV